MCHHISFSGLLLGETWLSSLVGLGVSLKEVPPPSLIPVGGVDGSIRNFGLNR